jgi:hypothetical protein
MWYNAELHIVTGGIYSYQWTWQHLIKTDPVGYNCMLVQSRDKYAYMNCMKLKTILQALAVMNRRGQSIHKLDEGYTECSPVLT